MKIRFYIGILFIALQIGSIIYARFVPERFFCWAPYDTHSKFEAFVIIDGVTLTQEAAEKRYNHIMKGWEQRSIHNIFSIISQYERTYGKNDNASVLVKYETNGDSEKEWRLE